METAPVRTPTGIPGFDEIIGGGFPPERVVLILGEPGAGKTILCSQYLYNGAVEVWAEWSPRKHGGRSRTLPS